MMRLFHPYILMSSGGFVPQSFTILQSCYTARLLDNCASSRDRVAFEKCNRKLGRSDPVNDLLALIEVES
jgi:hypothetical protein